MKSIKYITLILMAIVILIPLVPASADGAPPMNPPGGDISPEGGTQVEMLAEQVIMDFRQSTDDSAIVNAWFRLKNTGTVDEHFKVRFPLNGDERANLDPVTGEFSTSFPLIKDFIASESGRNLPYQVVKDTDPNAAMFFLGNSTVIYWAEFDMSFRVGTTVKLSVNYTFSPTEENSYAHVNYLMATGAGWKGPIGTADVLIRFPYILNEYNLPYYPDGAYYDRPGEIATVRENEVWIHWDNLEPTSQDNVRLTVLQSHLWQQILQQRGRVISSPNDANAWAALAHAYADAGQEKHFMFSNQNLANAYVLACERALTLNPNNVALHVEFARNTFYASVLSQDASYFGAISKNELATALKLYPTNVDALALYDQMHEWDGSLTLPPPGPFPTYATSTPTFEPTATPEPPTPTIQPTTMPTPLPTWTQIVPTPLATPVQAPVGKPVSGALALLGALVMLAIGFGAGWFVRHGK